MKKPITIKIKRLFIEGVLCCLFFCTSCRKKEEVKVEDLCITVTDYQTKQPVEGASVEATFLEDLTAQSGGWAQYGTSGSDGNCCISGGGFKYIDGVTVTKQGYEPYCPLITSPLLAPKTFEAFMFKRNGFLKMHIINQPPVSPDDKLYIGIMYDNQLCSGNTQIEIPPGSSSDTVIVCSLIAGPNKMNWQSFVNGAQVNYSTIDFTVPQGDTTLLNINY